MVQLRGAGFSEIAKRGELLIFEHPLDSVQAFPSYVEVELSTVDGVAMNGGAADGERAVVDRAAGSAAPGAGV